VKAGKDSESAVALGVTGVPPLLGVAHPDNINVTTTTLTIPSPNRLIFASKDRHYPQAETPSSARYRLARKGGTWFLGGVSEVLPAALGVQHAKVNELPRGTVITTLITRSLSVSALVLEDLEDEVGRHRKPRTSSTMTGMAPKGSR